MVGTASLAPIWSAPLRVYPATAALGLVCLARFGRSRSLGLGWPGLPSGWVIAGVWHVFCFAVGRTTVHLYGTPDISTLFKVSMQGAKVI